MVSPGYVVGFFQLTPYYKTNDLLSFDHFDLGVGGLNTKIFSILSAVTAGGHKSDKHSSWFRVESLSPQSLGDDPKPLIAEIDGGKFGSAFGRYDVASNRDLDPVSPDHVLTRKGFLLLCIPSSSTVGFLVSEADGTATHIPAVFRYLNDELKHDSLTLRVQYDVADLHAWKNYLEDEDTWVRALRLSKPNPHGDGTTLAGDGVSGAKVEVDLNKDSQLEKEVRKKAKRAIRTGEAGVTSLATGHLFEDDAFESTSFVTTKDGKDRTLNVSRPKLPRFVYRLDGEERPEIHDLLTQSRSVVAQLIDDLGVDLPRDTWPL